VAVGAEVGIGVGAGGKVGIGVGAGLGVGGKVGIGVGAGLGVGGKVGIGVGAGLGAGGEVGIGVGAGLGVGGKVGTGVRAGDSGVPVAPGWAVGSTASEASGSSPTAAPKGVTIGAGVELPSGCVLASPMAMFDDAPGLRARAPSCGSPEGPAAGADPTMTTPSRQASNVAPTALRRLRPRTGGSLWRLRGAELGFVGTVFAPGRCDPSR
jgi:hypothetical protein